MTSLKKLKSFNYDKVTNERCPDSEGVLSLEGRANLETVSRRPAPKHGHFTAICSLLVILILLGLSIVGVAVVAMASYSKANSLQDQDTHLSSSLGVVYTRWGGASCHSNDTVMLYSGLMGGTRLPDIAGGSSHLCLPSEPQYPHDSMSNTLTNYDFVTVSSYKSSTTDSVPCAVCAVVSHTQSLMIPAMTSCPKGWALGYHGYLMSGSARRTAEFVCVDHDELPDSVDVMEVGLLSYVKALCTSLPCPPYNQQKRLNCVVCIK